VTSDDFRRRLVTVDDIGGCWQRRKSLLAAKATKQQQHRLSQAGKDGLVHVQYLPLCVNSPICNETLDCSSSSKPETRMVVPKIIDVRPTQPIVSFPSIPLLILQYNTNKENKTAQTADP